MTTDSARLAARDAYFRALGDGASNDAAFTTACDAYRRLHPELDSAALRAAVAAAVADAAPAKSDADTN